MEFRIGTKVNYPKSGNTAEVTEVFVQFNQFSDAWETVIRFENPTYGFNEVQTLKNVIHDMEQGYTEVVS